MIVPDWVKQPLTQVRMVSLLEAPDFLSSYYEQDSHPLLSSETLRGKEIPTTSPQI